MATTSAKRSKITSSVIDEGRALITHYTAPDAQGHQEKAGDISFTPHAELPPEIVHDLAALGFVSVLSQKYGNSGHPDIPSIAVKLYGDMKAGNWHPGKPPQEREPTDLQRAIAEVMHVPVSEVIRRFDTELVKLASGEPYRDASGKTRRAFSKDRCAELAQRPEIASVLARLAQERAARFAAERPAAGTAGSLLDLFAQQP